MVIHTKEALRAEAIHTQLLQEALRAEVAVHTPHLREVLQAAVLTLHQAGAQVQAQVVLHLSVHLLQAPAAVHQAHLAVAAVAAEAADVAAVAVDVVN